MEEKRLNFFADINKQAFVIIGGLVAISTLIPLFINRLQTIFGFPVSWSYYLFVFLYFVFPVIFYLLYCSIYGYVGFLKLIPTRLYQKSTPKRWKYIELGFIFIIFLWLCWGNLYSKWGAGVLYAISIVIFFIFSKKYANIKNSRKEFKIIGISLISIFSLFLFSGNRPHVPKELTCDYNLLEETEHRDVNSIAFKLFERQKQIPDSLLKPVDQLITKYQQGVVRVSIKYPNKSFGFLKLSANDSNYLNVIFKSIKQFQLHEDISNANFVGLRDTIITLANNLWPNSNSEEPRLDTSYKLYQTFLSIQSYLQIAAFEKSFLVKKYWALLLSNLQVKGLSWFFFLIIVCLCLWLQSMNELSVINSTKKTRKNADTDIQQINDNSNQIRSLFYVVLLLVIPFFKEINEKTVNLSMPFVDFGIQKFYQSDVNIYGEETDYTSEFAKIRKQLGEIEKFNEYQKTEIERNKRRLNVISKYSVYKSSGQDEYDSIDKNPNN